MMYNMVQSDKSVSIPHGNAVAMCAAFDGHTIATGCADHTVRLWRAPFTGACERVIEGHTSKIERVWLCPPPNGHIVVSVDWKKRVFVHNIRTGEPLCAPIECDCKSCSHDTSDL